jgi:type II secretion system protein N
MRLIKFSGYLLYTLAVLLFLLRYKFPVDALRTRIEKDLNRMTPALQWTVKEIALLPPFKVQLRHISIIGKEEKKVLLIVETMNLRPDLTAWKKTGNIAAKYRLHLLNGTMDGHLALTKDRRALEYDGAMRDIRIDDKEPAFLRQEYQRTVRGTLAGDFSGRRKLTDTTHILRGTFQFAKGTIGLQQPVLGMEQLDFDSIATELDVDTGTVLFSKGKVTSPLFSADFQGNLHTVVPCRLSHIQLTGSFQPGPEFTASVHSPSLVNMLKKEMRQGSLPFTVNGPLKEPGIVFTSLPPAFNRQMGLQKGLPKKPLRQLPQRSR